MRHAKVPQEKQMFRIKESVKVVRGDAEEAGSEVRAFKDVGEIGESKTVSRQCKEIIRESKNRRAKRRSSWRGRKERSSIS